MNKKQSIFVWLATISLGTNQIFCQSIAGPPFLNMGVGAHAQSMGGSYTAQVKDASAVYWNPSNLTQLEFKELFFYQSKFISDSQYSYIAYGHPLRSHKSAFGFGLGYLSKGIYDGRDDKGARTGEFSASDSLMSLAYGRKIGNRGSAGIGVKVIQSNI